MQLLFKLLDFVAEFCFDLLRFTQLVAAERELLIQGPQLFLIVVNHLVQVQFTLRGQVLILSLNIFDCALTLLQLPLQILLLPVSPLEIFSNLPCFSSVPAGLLLHSLFF